MSDIYIYKINKNLNKQVYENFLNKLPCSLKEKIQKYRFYEDSLRSMFAYIIVNKVFLSRYSKTIFEKLVYNEYGKPYVEGFNDFRFNITHSGDYVVVGTDSNPIGVDIEMVSDVDLNIAQRFFSSEERQALFNLTEVDQIDYFFKLWTLKESYIKCVGKGLSIPLKDFTISVSKDIGFYSKYDNELYYFHLQQISNNYYLAVCQSQNYGGIKLKEISINDLV